MHKYLCLVIISLYTLPSIAQDFLSKYDRKANISTFGDNYLIEYQNKKQIEVLDNTGKVILKINSKKENPVIDKMLGLIYYGGTYQSFNNKWNYGQFFSARKRYNIAANEESTLPYLVEQFMPDFEPPIAVAADTITKKVGLISANGEPMIPLEYDGIFMYDKVNSLLLVVKDDYYYLINSFNFNILPTKYRLTDEMLKSKKLPKAMGSYALKTSIIASLDGNKVGIYDYLNKKQLIPFDYYSFKLINNEYLLALKKDHTDIYDTDLKLLHSESEGITDLIKQYNWNGKTLMLVEQGENNKTVNVIKDGKLLFKDKNRPINITLWPTKTSNFLGGRINKHQQFLYDLEKEEIVALFDAELDIKEARYFKDDELFIEVKLSDYKTTKIGFYNTRTQCLTSVDKSESIEIIMLNSDHHKAYYIITYKENLDYYTKVVYECNQMIQEPYLRKNFEFKVENNMLKLINKSYIQEMINNTPYGGKTEKINILIYDNYGKKVPN